MGIVPPLIVQPADAFYALGITAQEAADALTAAFTSPWYAIWLDDGLTSERYGTSAYSTPEEAQAVCDALQKAYQRLYYECRFLPSLRGKKPEEELILLDPRLISPMWG